MRLSRRLGGFEWRFSLSEIMVAVAVDAVLVAAILDVTRSLQGQATPIYDTLKTVTYLVVPTLVVPVYWATRWMRTPRARRWHTRRNDVLMALVPVVVGLAALLISHEAAKYRGRDYGYELVVTFIPILLTLFLADSLAVQWLQGHPQDDAAAAEPPHPLGPPAPDGLPRDGLSHEGHGRHERIASTSADRPGGNTDIRNPGSNTDQK